MPWLGCTMDWGELHAMNIALLFQIEPWKNVGLHWFDGSWWATGYVPEQM